MGRYGALVMLCCVIVLVGFSTWNFYRGDLVAGASSLPLLAIVYLLMVNRFRTK